jgi:hypothetical protein
MHEFGVIYIANEYKNRTNICHIYQQRRDRTTLGLRVLSTLHYRGERDLLPDYLLYTSVQYLRAQDSQCVCR